MSDFDALVKQANRQGFAIGSCPLEALRLKASRAGLEEIAVRAGDETTVKLRPATREQAHPASLSAVVGTGLQPLHSDAAHHLDPPKYVVLHSEGLSSTPTRVWKITIPDRETRENLSHGYFIVGQGRETFIVNALAEGRFRFNPACMEPADARATKGARFFEEMQSMATEIHWNEPNRFLLLANWIVLHGRAEVDDTDQGRELSRIAFNLRAADI